MAVDAPIERFVSGTPYGKTKPQGRRAGVGEWRDTVIEQTRDLPRVSWPCELDVVFVLPANKFVRDLPFGSDLDNLLKALLDALKTTVLRDAPGTDSAIIVLQASKRQAFDREKTGAMLSIRRRGGSSSP